ncbi:MAG: hypothetical protein JJLCMIEE_00735 [Acidimicrobiales bacterium]|nr:hypothetical protein [Acidimicrobiales bacterium]
MADPRTPCIIGVAQRTWRESEGGAPEPLDMWEHVCRQAAADSGGREVLAAADDLRVVYCQSWQYDDPPGRLAERLGLRPGNRAYSGMSGTSAQQFIQDAAVEILAGRRELAVVTGAEALATTRRLRKAGETPSWSFEPAERPPLPFEDPFHPSEIAHEVLHAYLWFAVFDVARRAHLGLSPDEHRRQLGELLAPMTKVAASNPNAWFPTERSVDEIITPSEDNRMVSYPYTKYMVAVMDVDMAAAVILTSEEKADELGVPRERRVYLRGWAKAKDPPYIAQREEMWRSAGMRAAGSEALSKAEVDVDDIAYFDLYSCFGSSVSFACDALGLSPSDGRPLTVTGGLPYHGGPGSNYMAHSVATMVERLREDPSALGVVSGVGMEMTNHAFAVYSTAPGTVEPPDAAAVQRRTEQAGVRPIADAAEGEAAITAYSVLHGRQGPLWGLAVCDLPDGSRCYARTDHDDTMAALEAEEWVGRSVVLSTQGNVNRFSA